MAASSDSNPREHRPAVLELLAGLLIGYAIGGVPTAAIAARARRRDVFAVGSGNMGAMNTARNLGFGLGALVLAVDIAKGAFACWLGLQVGGLLGMEASGGLGPALTASFGAVLGHAFSPYVGFRGGKGLATTLGVALPLYPVPAFAGLALLIVLSLALRRRSDLAAVLTILVYPVLVRLLLGASGWTPADANGVLASLVAIALLVLVKHALAWRRSRRRTVG